MNVFLTSLFSIIFLFSRFKKYNPIFVNEKICFKNCSFIVGSYDYSCSFIFEKVEFPELGASASTRVEAPVRLAFPER